MLYSKKLLGLQLFKKETHKNSKEHTRSIIVIVAGDAIFIFPLFSKTVLEETFSSSKLSIELTFFF